ncbi:hypothetical protein P167DRAFT_574900 [Morchella conica CCBAS932]|uniref:Uncharacterized protein n=1 Tax=Morchella conica CCBAS932 TaxID=1392247 RepID=A0A3N4KRR0_9PEZI|nr:hypothetical protein P167DRAFT_574900 [Morchella conica CCBAS932]
MSQKYVMGEDEKTVEHNMDVVIKCEKRVRRSNKRLSGAICRATAIGGYSAFWQRGICFVIISILLNLWFWFLSIVGEDTEVTSIDFIMEDAFFTLMGGYISVLTGDSVKASTVKITSEGLLQLFSTGVLSASELAKIKPNVADHSKTDTLAKLLVCIQAR